MTPRIMKCVERARHYQDQLLKEVSKHQTADNRDRSLVSTAYIKMVNGDYGAILTLVAAENPGAAFKLFRLLYEDVINALWVQAFAPTRVIKKLLQGKKGQVPGTMTERAAKLDTIFVPPADRRAGRESLRRSTEQVLESGLQLYPRRFIGDQPRTRGL